MVDTTKQREAPYKSIEEAHQHRKHRPRSVTREKVKEMYLTTDMSQADIAKKLGLSQASISHHIRALLRDESNRNGK